MHTGLYIEERAGQYLGISEKQLLREAMLLPEVTAGTRLEDSKVFVKGTTSPISAEGEHTRDCSDFLGDEKRLSGRMCSKLKIRIRSISRKIINMQPLLTHKSILISYHKVNTHKVMIVILNNCTFHADQIHQG